MKFIGSGFGEDFDPSQPEAVEFRGKRILIDADLPDGILGRQLPSAEAVNEDGRSTPRPRRRPCQRL